MFGSSPHHFLYWQALSLSFAQGRLQHSLSGEVCPHIDNTYSLQCYFIKLSSASRYQTPHLEVNISLDITNPHMTNISSLDFHIWQHLRDHRSKTQLQHLTTILSIPVHKIYQHMINGTQHITPFNTGDESTGDTDLIWTLCSHTGIYVMAIGSLIPAGLGIFCCYFIWCWLARLVHQPLQPGNTQYTIVNDDGEAAPFYRCDGKVLLPTRPHKNHVLAIQHLPTWMESQCKQQSNSLVVPVQGLLENWSKIQGTQKCTYCLLQDLGSHHITT